MWQAVPYLLVELSFKSLSKIKKNYENIVYAPFSYNTLGCCLYLKNLTHYFTLCAQRPGLWWIEATLEKSCCFVVVFCFHRNDHFHGLAGIKITQFAHKKTGQVSSIARSPSASLLSKGQGTEDTKHLKNGLCDSWAAIFIISNLSCTVAQSVISFWPRIGTFIQPKLPKI